MTCGDGRQMVLKKISKELDHFSAIAGKIRNKLAVLRYSSYDAYVKWSVGCLSSISVVYCGVLADNYSRKSSIPPLMPTSFRTAASHTVF